MQSIIRSATFVAALALCGVRASAQVRPDSVSARQQRTLDSLSALVRAMQVRMDSVVQAAGSGRIVATDTTASAQTAAPAPAVAAQRGQYMNMGFVAITDAGWSTGSDLAR